MGCINVNDKRGLANKVKEPPLWMHNEQYPISSDELQELRNIFWQNTTRFGGQQGIWQQLRRAVDMDLIDKQRIVIENGLTLGHRDMTVCFDENGYRYELPLFVLTAPSNMRANNVSTGTSDRKEVMDLLMTRKY